MAHRAQVIRRREDGSIDTSHYVDRGNKLRAQEIKKSMDACLNWFRALWSLRVFASSPTRASGGASKRSRI